MENDKKKSPAQALLNPNPVEIFSAFFANCVTGNDNQYCIEQEN
ncbi:MAG: hypothetical protein ACOX1I_03580 [Dethiobacteria bacterium]